MSDTPERAAMSPDDAMDIYVPGAWRCLQCGFQLTQATIFMASGQIGSSRDQVMRMTGECCPNDGTEMARVTWRERAVENQQWGESLMEEIIAVTGADSLPAAIARVRDLLAAPPSPWQPIETAPKDTDIVGWFPVAGGCLYRTHWCSDIYAKKPRPLWDVHGWIWGRAQLRACQPTHWMPMPLPPVSQEPKS